MAKNYFSGRQEKFSMSAIRRRIEKWFEHLAHLVYRHRILTLVVMMALSIALIAQIPSITIDTSTEGFLHAADPALLAYNEFRDQFGRDEVIIIAIKSQAVFDFGFLKNLKALHEELADKVPHLEEITSLINARNTRGAANELIVEDFLENWPRDPEELAVLKNRALSNPIYQNLLLSPDGRFTTIVIQTQRHSTLGQQIDVLEEFEDNAPAPDEKANNAAEREYFTDEENSQVVTAVQQIVEKYDSSDFKIYVAGSPVVTHFLKRAMMSDMRKFVGLAVATVAVLLFLMFRRITGVVFPLFIVVLSLLSTVGIMAITGTAIKVPTQILPSFLLAVGVGTSVHILAIFFQRYRETENKADAIADALGHSGLAVVMTNVTTACGLMSFATSEVAPVADLGIFAGIGVLIAFINTIILLPALIALVPLRRTKGLHSNPGGTLMDRLLTSISRFSTEHPRAILIVSAVVVAVSLAFAAGIRFSHDPPRWFPRNNRIRVASETLDHEMHGTINLEVIIDTAKENGFYEPDMLNRLEEAVRFAEAQTYKDVFVGKAWSLTTILKEINRALNENRAEFYAVPQNKDLIAQEFLLFENSGSDDLEDVVDSQFSKVRFSMKGPFKDAVHYGTLLETVDRYFKDKFPNTDIELTGMVALLSKTINNAIRSMAKSYVVALVVITLLMMVLIGKIRIGLLSMIPNLTPILLMLGIIGATPVSMDLFTMMVASIAIGLAVDDTIHFMHNFRRYYEQTGDPKLAVYKTLHTTGRAMLVTTVVLSIGFFIFVFADMNNLLNFGVLTSFTILMALLADYLVAPALMVLVNPGPAAPELKIDD
jgi:hydrophobe/amphiphile efflux-3 (HAE3) family protein